jgi:RimJ/RimL family protein N-acetyltransferase
MDKIRQRLQVKRDNVREYYEAYGLRQSILHTFERLAEYIGFSFYKKSLIFFEQNLQRRQLPDTSAAEEAVRKTEPADLEGAEDYHDGWFNQEQAIQRIRDGHLLFIRKKEGNMAFFQWIEVGKTSIPSIDLEGIELPQKTLCMAYSFTKPNYRKQGLASKTKSQVVDYLCQQGYRTMFLVISPENSASIKVNKRSRFTEYQEVAYRKVFFRKRLLFGYYWVKEFGTRRRRLFGRKNPNIRRMLWSTFLKTEEEKR